MTTLASYRVKAFNTATASTNKIHDDDVAASLGFRGGLVPGVDVYAYLTHPPVAAYGVDWLSRGTISARFASPVYDGEEVDVVAVGDSTIEVRNPAGEACATAEVGWRDTEAGAVAAPPSVADYPTGPCPAPADRPDASPEVFAAMADGRLGSLEAGFHVENHRAYLADVRESLPLYTSEGVAHPGWLLRFCNTILSSNVRLGPWIHVGSAVTFWSPLHDGERVSTRGRVTGTSERGGHGFVDLDVLLVANDERPVMAVHHTAIYRPRGLT